MTMTSDEERERIEKSIKDKLAESIAKEVAGVEKLGDLNVPITKVLATMGALQANMEDRDFSLAMMVIALLYDVDSELDFKLRLTKTILTLGEDGMVDEEDKFVP